MLRGASGFLGCVALIGCAASGGPTLDKSGAEAEVEAEAEVAAPAQESEGPCHSLRPERGDPVALDVVTRRRIIDAIHTAWPVKVAKAWEATPTWQVPGLDAYFVKTTGQHDQEWLCYVDPDAPPDLLESGVACNDEPGLLVLSRQLPSNELTPTGIAEVLGSLDRAHQVLRSPDHARRCLPALPEDVVSAIAKPTVFRVDEDGLGIEFVEHVQARDLDLLVRAKMEFGPGYTIERTELFAWESEQP